jgi:hypothetical protein
MLQLGYINHLRNPGQTPCVSLIHPCNRIMTFFTLISEVDNVRVDRDVQVVAKERRIRLPLSNAPNSLKVGERESTAALVRAAF